MYGLTTLLAGCAVGGLVYYGVADEATQTQTPPRARIARRVDPTVFISTPTTNPATQPAISRGPIEGIELVSVEEDLRFVPTTRPTVPEPQFPPASNTDNVDTGKPPREWQRLTDDWFGARPWLDDHGISLQASLTADWSTIAHDGSGSAFRELFNANVTLDTERLAGLKGGTVFVNFQQQAGENGGDDAGNIQGISNIDADGRTQISEAWYEQQFGERLRVKAGKIDANGDFAHAASADEFINGAFGAAPTILGFPTYPDPSTGVSVFVKPTEQTYIGFGIFDGSTQEGRETGSIGPAGLFDGGVHLFYIAEAGVDWTVRDLAGRLSVGGWHHTANFERFDGGTESSASGWYVMLDQQLWRENPSIADDAQGVSAFLKFGHADGDVSAVDRHVAGGFAWTGLLPGRDEDVLGLGLTWAGLSHRAGLAHGSETVYELFYRLRLNAWLSIKPDVQYIVNPADSASDETLVATVRVVIDF